MRQSLPSRKPRRIAGPRLIGLALLLAALALPWTCVAADSPTNSTSSNTLVRFEIQRGTNALGAVDVELFDQDKPETVRNFLLYVRGGAYSNSFLHRCVPGFAVQGGGFSMADPNSTNRFSSYLEVRNYGRLTNEYFVGPEIRNVFGTLAMAKQGGDPNSATGQWFFNLADNPSLDSQNGGFTVFGRVLESTNGNPSSDVLRHFNTLSANGGLVNLGNLLGSAYAVFSDLPVSYTNTTTRVPINQELYYTRISIVNQTNVQGLASPTINLLSPAPNSRFTNQPVALSGTATDDTGVARVVYSLQGGPLEIGTGTTNWTVTLTPTPGINTVTVQSVDADGNFSTNTPAVSFLYVAEVPLQLQVVGAGSVAGATNGQVLQAGHYYTLTATPASGSVFDSWTGSAAATTPSITFQVPASATNFGLTARFIPDPLPQLAGAYQGLFRGTNATALENAGYLTLALQSDGFFSGGILHRGGSYTYTGRFDANGNASIQGDVGGINRSFSLTLVKSNPTGLITGTILGSAVEVRLERLSAGLPGSNAPPVGTYTFVIPSIPASPPSQLVPGGNGFGTGTLDSNGGLSLSGTLGDGSAFAAAAPMTRFSRWPLYVTLFGGRGVLLGWLSLTNQPGALDGSLQWMKSLDLSAATYPQGFSNQVAFLASPYRVPAKGSRVLNWVNGLAEVTGTDLRLGITNLVKLGTNNAISVHGSNESGLQLNLDLDTGLVAGSFVHPWEGTPSALRGVVLDREQSIRGQFVAGTQTGSLGLDAAPFLVTQSVVNVTLPALTTALAEGGLLRFENDGVITLTNPLTIPYDTALDANGHVVLLSGGGTTRLFEVQTNVNFSARGITFANGRHTGTNGVNATQSGGDGCGAGILNLGGAVSLTNCVLTNFAVLGGAAGVGGQAPSSEVSGGQGMGAAVCNRGGQVILQDCLLAYNSSVGGPGPSGGVAMGGAFFSDAGVCQVQDTVFLRNRSLGGEAWLQTSGEYGRGGDASGGALALASGHLHLVGGQCSTNAAVGVGMPANDAGSGQGSGGALFVGFGAEIVADEVLFVANSASGGGSDQTRSAGTGQGGAAFNAGSLWLKDCSLEQNAALGSSSNPAGRGLGGAVASSGALTVEGCTLNDNLAQGGSYPTNSVPGAEAAGGAIYSLGVLASTNSTFAFNRAVAGSGSDQQAGGGDARGGALTLVSNSAVLINVTLAFNEAAPGSPGNPNPGTAFGGGIAGPSGTVTLLNSILASNAPANVFGALTDSGYNLSSDASFAFTATGSRTNTDPLLGPLATNGGPTRTMALLPDSPARDLVPTAYPPLDQRGTARPQGARGDAGAFEFVQTLPTIVIQPLGTNSVRAGTNFTFLALADGPGPISYSWIKDGALLPGTTNTTLVLTNVQAADTGAYAAVAMNSFGAVTSAVATLVVDLRPFILVEPSDTTVAPGGATALVVSASGPGLNYLWLHDSVTVPGATNAELIISNAAPGVQGGYQVVVSNSSGSVTSRVASLTFSSQALSILSPPQGLTVEEGGSARFSVLATGIAPIGYQWLFDSVPLANATGNELVLASVNRTNAGTYQVVVTNAYRTLTTIPVPLDVVVAQPVLSIAIQDTSVLITCRGDAERVHRLLGSATLAPGASWTPLATNALSVNGSFTWIQPLPTNGLIYYRAVTP